LGPFERVMAIEAIEAMKAPQEPERHSNSSLQKLLWLSFYTKPFSISFSFLTVHFFTKSCLLHHKQ
jgi:hypothetical protein